MSYEDAFASAWDRGGPDGALEFLRGIFHAPNNQKIQGKPTDYLSDRDDEYVSPAYGFDRMLKQFGARDGQPSVSGWMASDELLEFIEQCLVESRSGGEDQRHRVQPFNALVAIVSTYGYGEADLRSVHVDATGEAWKAQYGLHHQLIDEEYNYDPETEDDEDTYDFLYALEDGGRYHLEHEGEEIDGEQLFKHVRLAQYGVFLGQFVDQLFLRPGFADFPKALPFRVFITAESYDGDGSTEGWFEVRAPLTAESLADHPLRDAHLKSAEPPPELSTEEQWIYLLGEIGDPDSAAFTGLAAMLDSEDDLRAKTVLLAEHRRDGGKLRPDLQVAWREVPHRVSPVSWARLFWNLTSDHHKIGEEYVRGYFAIPLPSLEEMEFGKAADAGELAYLRLHAVWDETPPASKESLHDAYTAASKAANSHPHPAMRVLIQEYKLQEEHGDEAVQIERWGPAQYVMDQIPDDYVDAVLLCLDEMPAEFPDSGGMWDFVMGRLEGLGERAASAAPQVVELLERYCPSGSRAREQELKTFANVLFKMGVDSPPSRIAEHCEGDRYHDIDCYKEWSQQLPQRNWERFVSQFATTPADFVGSDAWDALIVDSKSALGLFASGVHEAENVDDIVARLCEAAATPSALLRKFVGAFLEKTDNRGRHKSSDAHLTRRVVRLLEPLPDRSDANEQMLRRARLLLLRFAIDAGETPRAEIAGLLKHYANHPMLLFFEAELDARADGPEAAGQRTIAAIKTLSADDMVYRKAFFQFAATPAQDWGTAEPLHGYTAFRWASDHQLEDAYREGEFTDGQHAMDGDPFYSGLERLAAKLTEEQLAVARRETAMEVAFGADLVTLSNDELADRLTPDSWNITSQIFRRLASEPKRHLSRLLDAYRWFRDDEGKRKTMLSFLWPAESCRPALLADSTFQEDLAWLIRRYPGAASQNARRVFDLLADTGQDELALRVASELPGRVVLSVFKSVDRAIESLGAYGTGIEIIDAILEDTSDKKPEYVLLTTNRGVMQFRKGDADAAEQTYDALFAMDWSRFDYDPSSRDPLVAKFLGGDLDAQIADVFRQYFAMAKFNAACVYANRERTDDAVGALREAATLNSAVNTADKFENEDDLAPIRDSAAYQKLIAEMGGEE